MVARRIGGLHRFTLRAEGEGLVRQPGAVFERLAGIIEQNLPPSGFTDAVRRIIERELVPQPVLIKRVGTDEVVQPANRLKQGSVVPAGIDELRQLGEFRPVLPPIILLGALAQGLVAQGPDLPLIPNREIGRQAERLRILPDQVEAEGVDGADLRTAEQKLLAA